MKTANISIITFAAATVLAISLLSSCENELDYNRNDIPEQLMMNAQMSAADSIHYVNLSISHDLYVDSIKNGSVRCYINGKLAAEGYAADPDDQLSETDFDSYLIGYSPSVMKQKAFAFKAVFKAGDIVRVEAEANDAAYKASAEITVPGSTKCEITDTTRQNSGAGYYYDILKIRVKGNDIPGESNYFRIQAAYTRRDSTVTEIEGRLEPKIRIHNESGSLFIDNSNDAILHDGATADGVDINGSSENIYNVFSDNLFTDGTFSIGFNIDTYCFDSSPDCSYDYDEAYSEGRLIVTVSSISETEYNYLKAMSVYQYSGGLSFFTEPVSFPDNVDGGTGIVSIVNPSVAEFRMNRRTFGSSDSEDFPEWD